MEDLLNVQPAAATANLTDSTPSVASIVINTSSQLGFAPSNENSGKTFPIEVIVNLNNSNPFPVNLLTVNLTFAWDSDIRPYPAPKVVTLTKLIHGRNVKTVKLIDEVEFKDLDPQIDYNMEMSAVSFLANNPLALSREYVKIKWRS